MLLLSAGEIKRAAPLRVEVSDGPWMGSEVTERQDTPGSSGCRTPAGLSTVGIKSVTNYTMGGNRSVVQEQLLLPALLAPAAMETPWIVPPPHFTTHSGCSRITITSLHA